MKIGLRVSIACLLLVSCGDLSPRGAGKGDAGRQDAATDTGVPGSDGLPADSGAPHKDGGPDASLPDGGAPPDASVQPVNHAPKLQPIGSKEVEAGSMLTFRVRASDPDGDVLSLEIRDLPEGAGFNADTGVFFWEPFMIDVGLHGVTFMASDGELSDFEDVRITVTAPVEPGRDAGVPETDSGRPEADAGGGEPDAGIADAGGGADAGVPPENHPPEIAPIQDVEVHAGELVTFRITAVDPDQDRIFLESGPLPGGAAFNRLTGVFTWTPADDQVGDHSLVFFANDGELETSEEVAIRVLEAEPGQQCPSGIWCRGVCCDAGLLCIEDQCAVAGLECGELEPCGAVCCGAGEVCFNTACTAPGKDCRNSLECPSSEYCEPALGKCLSREIPGVQCEYRPPVGQFSPAVLWEWTGSQVLPQFNQVMMTPVVINITDDDGDGDINEKDIPDVIFNSYIDGGSHAEIGVMRAVRGDSGAEIFTVSDANYRVNGFSTIAAGDIDGDRLPELVTGRWAGQSVWQSGMIAFEHDGAFKWISETNIIVGWGGPSIADLEGDGAVEVVVGNVVVSGVDGTTRCRGSGGTGCHDGRRPLSIPVDLDGDGVMEIVAGNTAYRADCSTLWSNGLADGFPAVADLNGDGEPEIVVIAGGTVRVQSRTGAVLLGPVNLPGSADYGGPPTIADFDGDGRREFASAGNSAYTVFKPDFGAPAIRVLWTVATQDASSRQTGSSVFDFEGDGRAEVVYNDECYTRVYDGPTGSVLFAGRNTSCTTYEYPVIADINYDSHAEIVSAANNACTGISCPYGTHGSAGNHGIRVFKDFSENWVPTRRIWNEHTYHVTNVCDGLDEVCPEEANFYGTVPRHEMANWDVAWLNNFRQNVQGEGLFNAPDLVVTDLVADLSECNNALLLVARVGNQGSRGVRSGLKVSFYEGAADGPHALLGTAQTGRDLLPGGSEDVVFRWPVPPERVAELIDFFAVADDRGDETGEENECVEDNNYASVEDMGCSLNCPQGVWVPSPETCNDVDDDCDGEVDEDLSRSCVTACGYGFEVCDEGEWVGCTAPRPEQEVCDGIDNDCDAEADEGVTNRCGGCGPEPAEVCNDLDDDCDGRTDENVFRRCFSDCGEGQEQCEHGRWLWCSAAQPLPEECNGLDDDCDGAVDDGLARQCMTACGRGEEKCEWGHWEECNAPQPDPEVCDGLDNDCDGAVDDGVKNRCGRCGPEPAEVCDGLDNDCDGAEDEGDLCRAGEKCWCGGCIPRCIRGECFNGEMCENDWCVKDSCPDALACAEGKCL